LEKCPLVRRIKNGIVGHNEHCYVWRKKVGGLQAENTIPTLKHGGGSIMGVLCCRRDWCTSQIDGIMREDNYVDILKHHLKTSFRKLKLGHKWVFQMNNYPKHTSNIVAKWRKDNKVKVLE
jgi:hypothetical protein